MAYVCMCVPIVGGVRHPVVNNRLINIIGCGSEKLQTLNKAQRIQEFSVKQLQEGTIL